MGCWGRGAAAAAAFSDLNGPDTYFLSFFVCSAEIEPLFCGPHFRAGLGCAHPFKLRNQQVQLQYELPQVLVLPDMNINFGGRLANFFDIAWVQPYSATGSGI